MTNFQPTESTNKTENRKIDKSQDKEQKFLQRIIAVSFAVQAALIGVRGNLDVLSGKSPLDVIPSMLAQGIELILKAQGIQKRLQKSESVALLRKRCDSVSFAERSPRVSADCKPRSDQ